MSSPSPKEYDEFADECLRYAGETRSESHRHVLLEMAKTWHEAALEIERSWTLMDDLPAPRRRPA